MRRFTRLLFLFLLGNFYQTKAFSQSVSTDSVRPYYQRAPEMMNLRYYFSRKYTEFQLAKDQPIYEPNSGLNMGLGFTFQKFTLNIAVPWGFLNPNRQTDWKGNLDLQAHTYTEKWNFDLFGQFYNGFTLPAATSSVSKSLRQDVEVRKFGANVEHVFFGDKISLAAAKDQSQIQLRSAISPLLGFGIYRVRISGDSILRPISENAVYSQGDFFQIGPTAGVLGTLVFGKGFFLTGAFSSSLNLGFSQADQQADTQNWDWQLGYLFRGFAGYNHPRFSINVNYVVKNLNLPTLSELDPSVQTGNYRLNFIYKIQPGPKFTKTYTKYNPVNILSRLFQK